MKHLRSVHRTQVWKHTVPENLLCTCAPTVNFSYSPHGRTTSLVLLFRVPFCVVTVTNPVVAPIGTSATICGRDNLEPRSGAVEADSSGAC